MKKVISMVVLLMLLLCACGSKKDAGYLEFPKTTWGMSEQEVLDAYGVTKEDALQYDTGEKYTSVVLGGQQLFGEEADKVVLNFLDLGNGKQGLYYVRVIYRENVDMKRVLAEMQKAYGGTIPAMTVYEQYSALDSGEMPQHDYTESDQLKLWGSNILKEAISEKEIQNYAPLWEEYQEGLNTERWSDFCENARLVNVIWSDSEIPQVDFNAYNLAVYNELTQQLSDQQ